MASKQESNQDYFERAKAIARAERELGFEQWDKISIEREGDKPGEYVRLYGYDLPRKMAERYEWVIRWRAARLQCQYPRYTVRVFHSLYRRIKGANIGMQQDIDRFISAKAQVSRLENALEDYVAEQKENNLFYDEATDLLTVKSRAKLAAKRDNVAQAEARLKEKVRTYEKTQSINC